MEDAAGEDARVGTARRSGDDGDGCGNGEETEVLDSNAQDEKLVDSEDEEKEGGVEEDEDFGEAQDYEDLDSDEELDDSEEEDEEGGAEEDEEFGEAQDNQVLDSDEELDDSEEEEEEGGAEEDEEFGEAQDPAWFQVHRLGPDEEELLVVTPPSQGSAEEDLGVVEEFFQQMDQFERQPAPVSSVRVTINESRTLRLCSSLVCSFLRRHRFSAWDVNLYLLFNRTGDGDQAGCGDDTVFSMAKSFFRNKAVAEGTMKNIVATVVPTHQEQVDRLVRVALDTSPASLILRDAGVERASLLQATTDLCVRSSYYGDASIVVQSPSLDEAVIMSVVTSQEPLSFLRNPTMWLTSSALRAAEAAVVALADLPDPPRRDLLFVAHEVGLDASALYHAALRCRNLQHLYFKDFKFAAGATVPDGDIARGDACASEVLGVSSLAPLESLTLEKCEIGTAVITERPIKELTLEKCTRGVNSGADFACELAAYLSRTCGVQVLRITIMATLVEKRDMKPLCNALTHAECTVEEFEIHAAHGSRGFSNEAVVHFFERLPRMKSLRHLSFECTAPADLAPTVLAGLERNYSLTCMRWYTLQSDDSKTKERIYGEMDAFTTANRRGRGIVARATMDPNNAALRSAALDVIHRLAKSSDPADFAPLLLCLRLFVPAFAWGASSGGGGGGDRPPVARRRSRPDE